LVRSVGLKKESDAGVQKEWDVEKKRKKRKKKKGKEKKREKRGRVVISQVLLGVCKLEIMSSSQSGKVYRRG
jgi:hypothetical protein